MRFKVNIMNRIQKAFGFLLVVCILLSFTSCSTIYFDVPQPKNAKNLKVIPELLQGTWKSDSHSLLINDTSFCFKKIKNDTLVSEIYYILSDSMNIRMAKELFVANVKQNDWWQLFILKIMEDDKIYFYYPSLDQIKKIKKIEFVKTSKESVGGTKLFYRAKLKSKDIGNIIDEKSRFMILSGDSLLLWNE